MAFYFFPKRACLLVGILLGIISMPGRLRAATPMVMSAAAKNGNVSKPSGNSNSKILPGTSLFVARDDALYATVGRQLQRYIPATGRRETLATAPGAIGHFALSRDKNRLLLHCMVKKQSQVYYHTIKPASAKPIPLEGLQPLEVLLTEDGARAVLVSAKADDSWHFRVHESSLSDLKLAWHPMFEGSGLLLATRGDGLVFAEPTPGEAAKAEPALEKVLIVDFRTGKTKVVHAFKAPPEGRQATVLADEGDVTWLHIVDGATNAMIVMVDWAKGTATSKALPRDHVPFGPSFSPSVFWFVIEAPGQSHLVRLETEGDWRFIPDGTLATDMLRRFKTARGFKRHGLFWKRLGATLYVFNNAGAVREINAAPGSKVSWTGSEAFLPDPDSFYLGAEQGAKSFVVRIPLNLTDLP